jgi:hypothetical protein
MKYAKSKKFTVFLSFVQSFNDEAGTFLKKNAPTIPCYLQVRLKHAPCGRGIHHAVLFDHTGKIVAKGSPNQLLEQVEALVKATPDPPPPILGGIEVKYCKSQVKPLVAGKAIAPALKYLKALAAKDNDKGKEAKSLIDAANKYVEIKIESLKKETETTPAKTLAELKKFYIQIRGMKPEKEVKGLILKLKKDKNVNLLASIMKKVDVTQTKIAKRGKTGKSDRKIFTKAKAALQKMIDSEKTSDAVKNEAKEFIKTF